MRTVYTLTGTVARDVPYRDAVGVRQGYRIKKGERVIFEFRHGRQLVNATNDTTGKTETAHAGFFKNEVEDIRVVPVDANPSLWEFAHDVRQNRYVTTEAEALGRLRMLLEFDYEFLDAELEGFVAQFNKEKANGDQDRVPGDERVR